MPRKRETEVNDGIHVEDDALFDDNGYEVIDTIWPEPKKNMFVNIDNEKCDEYGRVSCHNPFAVFLFHCDCMKETETMTHTVEQEFKIKGEGKTERDALSACIKDIEKNISDLHALKLKIIEKLAQEASK